MAADALAGLVPSRLFEHFAPFTQIPRPSGQEQAISDHVRAWAADRGFEVVADPTGNLVVRVPATKGREGAPTVVIQGHLDMVCERNEGSPYDAETGPLSLKREGDWITAEGTTLGADNAIGVAAGMAVADDPEVPHGPLELLMTVDEETGMTGAMTLDGSMVKGRIMLNLDAEELGVLYVGCAGGCDTRFSLPLAREAAPSGTVLKRLSITGLKGGHSGLDINTKRQNAVHSAARILDAARAAAPLRLVAFDGGSKRNAIPREAFALIRVAEADVSKVQEAAEAMAASLNEQHRGSDEGLVVKIGDAPDDAPADVLDEASADRLIAFVRALPSGVLTMSQDIEGLVETSTNLGVARTEGDTFSVISCTRSSVAPAMRGALDQLASVARLSGAEAEEHGAYPGWTADLSSKALAATKAAAERVMGKTPEVTAIHAGLECGLIGERVPGMDMISFGPDIRGAHSPDERVSVSSVERFYALLAAVLDDLSR